MAKKSNKTKKANSTKKNHAAASKKAVKAKSMEVNKQLKEQKDKKIRKAEPMGKRIWFLVAAIFIFIVDLIANLVTNVPRPAEIVFDVIIFGFYIAFLLGSKGARKRCLSAISSWNLGQICVFIAIICVDVYVLAIADIFHTPLYILAFVVLNGYIWMLLQGPQDNSLDNDLYNKVLPKDDEE